MDSISLAFLWILGTFIAWGFSIFLICSFVREGHEALFWILTAAGFAWSSFTLPFWGPAIWYSEWFASTKEQLKVWAAAIWEYGIFGRLCWAIRILAREIWEYCTLWRLANMAALLFVLIDVLAIGYYMYLFFHPTKIFMDFFIPWITRLQIGDERALFEIVGFSIIGSLIGYAVYFTKLVFFGDDFYYHHQSMKYRSYRNRYDPDPYPY